MTSAVSIDWAQEAQRALHDAGYPTRLSADEHGVELLVPFGAILHATTVDTLARIAARHDGTIIVDFAQSGIRFLPPRLIDPEATTDA